MGSSTSADARTPRERLDAVRLRMRELKLDLLVVRATDRYLNEYVPEVESTRVWLTAFTGSTGDAVVYPDKAELIVDGRYHAQADREIARDAWSVIKLTSGQSIEIVCCERIAAAAAARARAGEETPLRVGYEADRVTLSTLTRMSRIEGKIELVPCDPSPVAEARGEVAEPRVAPIRVLDEAVFGRRAVEKHASIAEWLGANNADALLLLRVDDIAWLTNLRGTDFPYQSTFRSIALVTRSRVIVGVAPSMLDDTLRSARPGVHFVPSDRVEHLLAVAPGTSTVLVDAESTSVQARIDLERRGVRVDTRRSPLTIEKSTKNKAELAAMIRAFGRADRVVSDAQAWLRERVVGGATITELDFAHEVERRFLADGAIGLSFRVIAAAGENGAVVHHPGSTRVIRPGEVVLLDTGAYFDEGYATDLTRTFYVGAPGTSPSGEARRIFTLVLRAAIAGMTARFPRHATGVQIDGIIRAPIWAAGYDYNHGTGHGVGINVHENPPRIGTSALGRIEPGQVFSIEPGIYLEGRLGVRIENLATVEPDPDHTEFLRVKPLTFAPLDEQLIDPSMLDERERAFLAWYSSQATASS